MFFCVHAFYVSAYFGIFIFLLKLEKLGVSNVGICDLEKTTSVVLAVSHLEVPLSQYDCIVLVVGCLWSLWTRKTKRNA